MAARRVLCGTPRANCTGAVLTTDDLHLRSKGIMCHGSHRDAYLCHRKYLKSQGWREIGPRMLVNSDDGPIRILTKQSRFGASLRAGKEQTRWTEKRGRRYTVVST